MDVLVAFFRMAIQPFDRISAIRLTRIQRGQKTPKQLTIRRFDCTKRTFEKFIRKRDRVFTLSRFFAT